MSGWLTLQESFANFVSRPGLRAFSGSVPEVGSKTFAAGISFVPEASYFSIRLVEMQLAEAGRYFAEFLPLAICGAEYTHGQERRRAPLVVSNDLVKDMIGTHGGGDPGRVLFTNVSIVRRAPVKAEDVSLFVGLYRVPYSDIARGVLQFAADVTAEFGGPAIGAGARVASKLYDRVADLFNLSRAAPRFGFVDGSALTVSRYVLVAGLLPASLGSDRLEVTDGRLKIAGKGDATGFDYCLLAIEHHPSLFSESNIPKSEAIAAVTTLPFHERWRLVASLLAGRKVAEAEQAMLVLRAEVIASADLTEADRLVAIGAYETAYTRFAQCLAPQKRGGMRGGRSGSLITGLRSEIDARRKFGERSTVDALTAVADQLGHAQANGVEPSEGVADGVFVVAAADLRNTLLRNSDGLSAPAASVAEALSIATRRG